MNTITDAGIYFDFDEEVYHDDPCPAPSLSSSIAKLLTERSPWHAWTNHPRLNKDFEPEHRAALDFGSAAHSLVLGRGKKIRVLDYPDFRTGAAKEARDLAWDEGFLPILVKDMTRAEAMHAAFLPQLAELPEAIRSAFREGETGIIRESEVALFVEEGPVWLRGLIDRLELDEIHQRALIVDYKTTSASAHPSAVSRRLYDLGQDVQAGFYRRLLTRLRPQLRHVDHVLLTQEVDPPYALSAVSLDPATWMKAEQQVEDAIELWAACLAAGDWPGYPPEVATAELPTFIETRWMEGRAALRRHVVQPGEIVGPGGLTLLSAG